MVKLSTGELGVLLRMRDLGYDYLARDGDNCLYAYNQEPKKGEAYFSSEGDYYHINDRMFQFIKWEDGKAVSVKALLAERKRNNEENKIKSTKETKGVKLNTFEKELLKRLYNRGYNFLARDMDEMLYAYEKEPIKDFDIFDDQWYNPTNSNWQLLHQDLYCDDFQFVKWKDGKATSIIELLKIELLKEENKND